MTAMRTEEIEDQARLLYDALGPRAIATAAQRAVRCEEIGETEAAHAWRRVQERIKERRGARQG